MLGGTAWVTISTPRVLSGPRNAARNELPEEVDWLTGFACPFQPSCPDSQAASQMARRGGVDGSGDRASICSESTRLSVSRWQEGSKNWATSSRQRVRLYHAVSRLHAQIAG